MHQALSGQLPSLNRALDFSTVPTLNWSRLRMCRLLRSFCFEVFVLYLPYSFWFLQCHLPSFLFGHCCHLQPSCRSALLATFLDCSSHFSFLSFSTSHSYPAKLQPGCSLFPTSPFSSERYNSTFSLTKSLLTQLLTFQKEVRSQWLNLLSIISSSNIANSIFFSFSFFLPLSIVSSLPNCCPDSLSPASFDLACTVVKIPSATWIPSLQKSLQL